MTKNQIKQKKTESTVQKLIEAFKNDFTVHEAVSYANISKQTYYNWIDEDSLLLDEINGAKSFAGQLAKKNIIKSINEGDISSSKWYLERRQKEIYSMKQYIESKNNHDINIKFKDLSDDELLKIIDTA